MIQIAGTLQALGDLQPEDIPSEAVPRALLKMPDDRIVVISGLTRDECRALARDFGDPVVITVKGVTP